VTAVAAAPDTMRSRVLRGLGWKLSSQIVLQVTRLAVGVILARLLTPSDYGLAAMVLVFSGLVLIFADLGLGAALVQRLELTELDRSTVFWTSLGAGLLCTTIGIAAAGPLAAFYGQPEVQPLFIVLSLSFVVTSLATIQSALLTREMNFRALEIRRMVGALLGAVIGITLAAKGYGAWAIVAQQTAVALTSTVLLWAFLPWRPRFVFSRTSLRDLGGFGARVFGTRFLFFLNRNTDNLLIGRFIGPAALGAYSVSYNVMLVPFEQIAGPVQDVLFPAFARLQDSPERIGSAWIRVNRLVGAISIPSLLGLIVVAPDFVHVVLGDKWSAATRVLQILAWVGLLQSLQRLNSSILMARDRTAELLRYSVIVLVASVTAFVIGLQWGLVGVAAGYAISSTIVEPYYTWITGRAIGISFWTFVRSLARIAQASLAMTAAVLAARIALTGAGLPAAATLGICILVGLAVYVPLCLWREPAITDEIRQLVSRPRAGSAPAQPVEEARPS
jgi:O-antigen/teichoic acid export membrane protein